MMFHQLCAPVFIYLSKSLDLAYEILDFQWLLGPAELCLSSSQLWQRSLSMSILVVTLELKMFGKL